MIIHRASLVLSSVFALLASVGPSGAVTNEVVRDIGSDAIPTCSCRHFGPNCVHVVPQGTTQCRITFADSAEEAQALRDQRCRDLHGGADLVWESFKCTTRDRARELRVLTRRLEQEARTTCGNGNYIVMGGWTPEFKCIVGGGGGAGVPVGGVTSSGSGSGSGSTGAGSGSSSGGAGPLAGTGGPGSGSTPGTGSAGASGGCIKIGGADVCPTTPSSIPTPPPRSVETDASAGGTSAGAGGASTADGCPVGQCDDGGGVFGMSSCRSSTPTCPAGSNCGAPGCP